MSRYSFGAGRLRPPLLFLVLVVGAGPSSADDAVWLECAVVANDADRLGCYDGVARSRGEVTGRADIEAFGKREQPQNPVEEIASRIARVSVSARGQRILTLENGQVWQENEAGRARLAVGDPIVVRETLMRYTLKTSSGLLIPVHRLD